MQLQTFLDLSGKYSKNLYRLLEWFKHATDKNGVFKVCIYESNLQGFRDSVSQADAWHLYCSWGQTPKPQERALK
nr:replication initiation protein [Helicobacter sp. NHP19-003]